MDTKKLLDLIVKWEAWAQCCGDGEGGLAKAYAHASDAAELRNVLTELGVIVPDAVIYESPSDAIEGIPPSPEPVIWR